MFIADRGPGGLLARAYRGARTAVLPAFGAGAVVGLVTGIPIVIAAGAGAILGLGAGATIALLRRPH